MTAPGPSESDADRLARVTLNLITEPGDPAIADLVDEIGAETVVSVMESDRHGRLFGGRDPVDRAIFRAERAEDTYPYEASAEWAEVGRLREERSQLHQRLEHLDPAGVLERGAEQGIRYVTPADAEWPRQLGALAACVPVQDRGGVPLGLWVKGELDLREATREAITVTGARSATDDGIAQAYELSADLAGHGKTIVSGAAYRVDQAALRGALSRDTAPVAVLASAVDRPYPVAHTQLLERVAQKGLVVSEAPPGAAPTRTRLLIRTSGVRETRAA